MEHIALINQIVEAEQKARQIAEEARDKLNALPMELKDQTQELRGTLFERAEHRIELVRQQEAQMTADTLERLDAAHQAQLAILEKTFAEHQEEWETTLFEKVTQR